MTLVYDPEGVEPIALLELVEVNGKNVLEIGCGDGRLTWRYAKSAGHVLAIDNDASEIAVAREECPDDLRNVVDFKSVDFLQFEQDRKFNVALFSWSL
jgi:ubiquinone/menaquinone biosynthesis C-methylase UbiE